MYGGDIKNAVYQAAANAALRDEGELPICGCNPSDS